MSRLVDLSGRRFGMLEVLERGPDMPRADHGGRTQWYCVCDCGALCLVEGCNLKSGNSESCGCTHGEKHGMGHLPEYRVWCGMWKRCSNLKSKSYRNYGGRGLEVSEKWSTFSRFYQDMGPRPTPWHTLERERNSEGYGPGNCVWATRKTQGNNRRGNLRITAFGVTKTLAQWAESTKLKSSTIRYRIVVSGWTPEEALSRPVQ